MADLTAILSGNPGRSISANRSAANGNLVLQGESWPLLYRDATRLGPPATCGATVSAACVPAGPSYPLAMTTANNVSIFDPSLDLSYADSYSVGLQRPVGRNWVVEMRYVGSRNHGGWATENWNETNIESNGFLEEFKLAMANLQSNIAAGRGNSFAYFGANTGTAPLPIILSHLVSGVTPAQAGDAARYTGANWTNSTLVGFLASQNPNPRNFVSSTSGLYGNTAFRANGRAAGFPSNLWVMNPDVNNATILTNVNRSRYDSLQLEARRRYANGFQFTGGYTYGIQRNTVFESLSRARYLAPGANVPHQFKVSGVLDIPFGDGRRFGSGAGAWLKAIAGGWTVSATGRYQWQSLVASGVRLVGMTHDELQDAYKIRIDESTQTVYIFPDDIVLNTRRAFNVSATSPNGYSALGAPEGRYLAPASFPGCVALYRGDCDSPDQIRLIAPLSAKTDLTVRKRITIAGSKNVEIQFDLLNLFGNVNFNPVFNPGAGSTVFQVTSGLTSATGTFEPGGQVGQLMVRFNW
jgi:hypothetical protein